MRQHERAIEDYNHAIRLDPNLAVAINARGLALHALGLRARAAEDFATARHMNPHLPPPPK